MPEGIERQEGTVKYMPTQLEQGKPEEVKREPVSIDHPGIRTSLILAEAQARRRTFARPRVIRG